MVHAGHNHFIEENPVQGMIDSYRSIINKILSINPKAHLFLAQVIHSGKLPKYGYIPKLNREVASLVKSLDPDQVHLVNVAKSFKWKKHTIKDKDHPTTTSATIIAEEWLKVLLDFLK